MNRERLIEVRYKFIKSLLDHKGSDKQSITYYISDPTTGRGTTDYVLKLKYYDEHINVQKQILAELSDYTTQPYIARIEYLPDEPSDPYVALYFPLKKALRVLWYIIKGDVNNIESSRHVDCVPIRTA